ncbi:MAG: hypothetical protein ABI868_20510 [Acidobacteriota bacterium]
MTYSIAIADPASDKLADPRNTTLLGYQDARTLNRGAAPDGAIRERWAYDAAVMRYRYTLVAE